MARAQIGLVLVSWTVAWGWSEWNRPIALPEPAWKVQALMQFLEELPSSTKRPYIPKETSARSRSRRSQQRTQPRPSLELNAADSAALEALPFIGPTLARRVIRFRDALGGFVRLEQLQEVYGVDSLAYSVVSKRVHVNAELVSPLCADTSGWSALRRHPYIGVSGARAIERYRDAHPLQSLEDLKAHPPIGDSLYEKWRPYLRLCRSQ